MLCSACRETTSKSTPPSSEDAPVCVVSTASGSSAEANWYEGNSFKFDYDELPTLTVQDSDTLIFSVDWDANILSIGEDYYTYTSNTTGSCYQESYSLQKNDDGLFTMEIKRRNNFRDEEAIFYIVNDSGKFVIKVLLPLGDNQA